jgi:hypothetical protein
MCAVASDGDLVTFFEEALKRGGASGEHGSGGMIIPGKFAMGWRPELPRQWEEDLPALTKLVKKCWHSAHAHRPSMEEVHHALITFWSTNKAELDSRIDSLSKRKKKRADPDGADETANSEEEEEEEEEDGEGNWRIPAEYAEFSMEELVALLINKEEDQRRLAYEHHQMSAAITGEQRASITKDVHQLVASQNQERRRLSSRNLLDAVPGLSASEKRNSSRSVMDPHQPSLTHFHPLPMGGDVSERRKTVVHAQSIHMQRSALVSDITFPHATAATTTGGEPAKPTSERRKSNFHAVAANLRNDDAHVPCTTAT